MKKFELIYLCAEPLLPPLYGKVRRRLSEIVSARAHKLELLDVGGRKSHYTIGLVANVTVTDLPRESVVQRQLNLGLTDQIINQQQIKRSNISRVLYDDMTCSRLPTSSFDCVVAVEVLEHVEEDCLFVQEVHRVLKPGGVFLMTTPNGDFLKNTNPDHKRHYTRRQLHSLLDAHFGETNVEYAIKGGVFRSLGLRSWSPRRPIQTVLSMFANTINLAQSSRSSLKQQAFGTHHLIATARKRSQEASLSLEAQLRRVS